MLPLGQDAAAVDPDVANADGELVRIGEGGAVGHGIGVEDNDVGPAAGLESPAIPEREAGGHGGGHLADGVLQGEDLLIADVLAQDARVGAVGAGVERTLRLRPFRVDAAGTSRTGCARNSKRIKKTDKRSPINTPRRRTDSGITGRA